jgi:hypothetical protein
MTTILTDSITSNILVDTLQNITKLSQEVDVSNTSTSFNIIIDILYKISMIIIAIANFIYAWKLNIFREKKDGSHRVLARKMDYLKTIIYEPNLKYLYQFFSDVELELQKLKDKNANKAEIEAEIQKLFKSFRTNFIIILNAAVPELGGSIQNICDNMRDTLLENLSDPGINLWVDRCYNDKIKLVFENEKANIISALFSYDGTNNER